MIVFNHARVIVGFGFLLAWPLASRAVGSADPFAEGAWFLDAIHAPEHIKTTKGSRKIVIAVVDDGVLLSHQDLKALIWTNSGEKPDNGQDDDGNGYLDDVHGWNVSDHNGNVSTPADRLDAYYHGTHVAGVIAQIVHRAYGARAEDYIQIMPVKSISDRADDSYLKDAYKGIAYAIDAGADIIVCAWGVGHISVDESALLRKARERGITIVAAAGNFLNGRPQYPAADDSVLAVAAVDAQKKKLPHSNFGRFVDLSAPGTHIRSAVPQSDAAYALKDGTSVAVPMVAAAVAMLRLHYPTYTAEQLEICLKSATETIDALNAPYEAKLGAGQLDIAAALQCKLLNAGTAIANALVHPQGYLRFSAPKTGLVSWAIAPAGNFKGLYFKLLTDRKRAGDGTVNFYANNAPNAPLVASYSLKNFPEQIYVPGTTAYVTFKPKKTKQQQDGIIAYQAEPIDFSKLYCQGKIPVTVEGYFEDGSGSADYAADSDCKWMVTAPQGKVVHFKFSEFDTEPLHDLLYFFDGEGTHEKIMAIFSGPNSPPEITTWHNKVLVWFVTNGQQQAKGWKGEIKFVDP